MTLKCHVPLDISKIEIKTKHVTGVKEKSSRSSVAAGTCDEKVFFPEAATVAIGHVFVGPL